MNFLILLASPDHFNSWDAIKDDERERYYHDYRAFADAVRERGRILAGDALQRPDTARTIQIGDGREVTEGPFAETVEQLGGFYVIDVDNVETAIQVARLLPREYAVEVRPTLGIEV